MSRFLTLPRELRDRIYDYLLPNNYYLFAGHLGIEATYGDVDENGLPGRLPSSIFACKQILNEALEQLRRGITFSRYYELRDDEGESGGLMQVRQFRKIHFPHHTEALVFGSRRIYAPSRLGVKFGYQDPRTASGFLRIILSPATTNSRI